jgi:branched-chain amino acid transport system substrate-binding protein
MSLSRRALLATAAASCAGRTAFAADKNPAPAPLTIGAALPLSGDFSLIGDECRRGIQLAAEAVNQAGGIAGKPILWSAADSVTQGPAAAVNGLINNAHADVLLGSGASVLSYPASAAAELAQIPYIELNAPADGITTRGFKYLLRTGPTTSMTGNLAAATIAARFAGRKIGLLFNTGATAGAIAAAAITALAAAKIPVLLAIGYPADVTDLSAPIGRLKRAGAQILLHAADPTDVLAFFAALQTQDWRPDALLGCGDGYLLRDTASAIGPAFDGTFAIGAPFYPPQAAAIKAAYIARFAAPPRSPDSLTAYCGAKLVFDTLAAQNGDATKLLDALRRANLRPGALANGFGAQFDHSGQNLRSFVTLQQWRDQQLS